MQGNLFRLAPRYWHDNIHVSRKPFIERITVKMIGILSRCASAIVVAASRYVLPAMAAPSNGYGCCYRRCNRHRRWFPPLPRAAQHTSALSFRGDKRDDLLADGRLGGASGGLPRAADVIPALGGPVWDTTSILSDKSVVGKVLHSLLGYEARPSGVQVLSYVIVLGSLMSLSSLVRSKQGQRASMVAVAAAASLTVSGPAAPRGQGLKLVLRRSRASVRRCARLATG
jgi:hypothetical protein